MSSEKSYIYLYIPSHTWYLTYITPYINQKTIPYMTSYIISYMSPYIVNYIYLYEFTVCYKIVPLNWIRETRSRGGSYWLREISVIVINNAILQTHNASFPHINQRVKLTSYALNKRYSSRGLASIGKPLTNKVRTCKDNETKPILEISKSKT